MGNVVIWFQIHEEARKFAYQTGVRVVVAYGGAPINQQVALLSFFFFISSSSLLSIFPRINHAALLYDAILDRCFIFFFLFFLLSLEFLLILKLRLYLFLDYGIHKSHPRLLYILDIRGIYDIPKDRSL